MTTGTNKETNMTNEALEKLQELIDEFDRAMLVTLSLDNKPRARPMAIAGHDDDGVLYFTTRSEDEKLEEVLHSPEVAVTMQRDDCYLSISGSARLETDVMLAEKMWSPALRAWFPGGYRDSQFTMIKVVPAIAEYWDRTGLRKLELLWETGKALLRGEKVDDRGLSGHEKIRLDQSDAKQGTDGE
jgi:general stress protein 26